jgi:hypothetical protein
MQDEWHKYNLKDSSTHPKDNSRVEMRDADGAQSSGGFLAGRFVSGGGKSATGMNLTKHWRYAE